MKCASPCPRDLRQRGFTLIELMISIVLMSIVLLAAYACMNAGLSSQRTIDPRTDIFQSARVAMNLIAADLRCACPLPKDAEFLGTHHMAGEAESDSIDFATHHYTPKRVNEGDFCEESVFMDKDAKSGQYILWRRRNPTIAFDSFSGGAREELASGLTGLKFEFYDGFEWYDSWGETGRRAKLQTSNKEHPNLSGLPEAVRVTLSFDSNPNKKPAEAGAPAEPAVSPLVFQTVVQLNLADSAPMNTDATPGNKNGQDASSSQPGGQLF